MAILDPDKIANWKCSFCGSKCKKVLLLRDINNETSGYIIHCCSCGHMDNFAFSRACISSMVTGVRSGIQRYETLCGIDPKYPDRCDAKECPYRHIHLFPKCNDKPMCPKHPIKQDKFEKVPPTIKPVNPVISEDSKKYL